MEQRKLSRPTDQRKALLRGQVTDLLWHGKIVTTFARAKEVQRLADNIINLAIDNCLDVRKEVKETVDKKGRVIKAEVVSDGPQKLNARRKMMAELYDIQDQRQPQETNAAFRERTASIKHPLIEKIFNVYAIRYTQRNTDLGSKGGYTRVIKLGARRGDGAEEALIELV